MISASATILTICLVCANIATVSADQQTDLMIALDRFSLKCYKNVLIGRAGQNVISSPLSAHILLALFSVGTGSSVEYELRTAMELIDATTTKSAYNTALNNWNAIQNGAVSIANKVFLTTDNTVWFTPAFDTAAQSDFLSQQQIVNYNNKIATQNIINTWINSKSGNTINNLVVFPNFYTPVAYFTNTILFKATWDKIFNPTATSMSPFYLSPTQTAWRLMMRQNNVFKYAVVPQWNAKIMEMTYENGQLSLVAILPDTANGLTLTETKVFNTANINTVLDTMVMTRLNVRFPRFKISTAIDMKSPILPNLGITSLLQYASFDYINMVQKNLDNDKFVYSVKSTKQRAYIEVNELGTKSTASTYFQFDWDAPVGKNNTGSIDNARTVRATQDPLFAGNRPFMFILRSSDKKILFIGRYIGEDTVNPIIDDTTSNINTRFLKRDISGILAGYYMGRRW